MINKPTIINPLHHHYPANTIGRDFIVGDLQGCYKELMGSLTNAGFNQTTDRVFCVGDLIDRGPKSYECANLVYEHWFHTTMGNHELMMIKSRLHDRVDYHNIWIDNGGLWYMDYEAWEIYDLAKSFLDLPLVISIGNDENRFNIVHAELSRLDKTYGNFLRVTNKDIDDWTFTDFDVHDMLWGRKLVDIRTPENSYVMTDINAKQLFHDPEQLSLTYVGHSIVPGRPVQVEQQIYLDTGMVNYYNPKYEHRQHQTVMTLACPQEEMFYVYSLPWKTTIKYPYSQMRKYS